jgi:Asp/Glu/hydantoin racemase
MNVLYQSKGNLSELPGYANWTRKHLESAAGADTAIEFKGTEKGGTAKGESAPETADEYRFFASLDAVDVARSAVRAPREGFDAVAVGNVLDPALRELRGVLDVPVLGLLETNVLVSAVSADRIGIVTDTTRFERMIVDRLRTYQLTDRVAALENADVMTPQIEACFHGDEDSRADLLAEFEAAVGRCAHQGAELVLPGSGALSCALAHCDLRRAHGVRIVDGPAVLLKVTEAMVDLYGMGATETSQVGTYESPQNLEELLAEYESKL